VSRNLRLFYLFRLLATSYLFVPIFMLFQADRGLSFFERLALGGIYSAVVIAVEIPTGVFADRLGRRRSMMLGALMMVASCLLAVIARDFVTFAIAESLAAVSMALCSGADSAYLFDLLLEHDRVHEYGRRESAASAWHLVGSAIAFAGGGMLAQIDLSLPYLVTAGVASIAAVVASMLDDDHPRVVGGHEPARLVMRSWGTQMSAAIRDVTSNGRLVWLIGYSAVVFMLLRATIYLYQPYLEQRGLGPIGIGLLFAGVYVVAAAVAYRTHLLRRRVGDELLLWALLAALAISFLGLAGAANGPWMLVLLLVQAVANGIYSPLTKPLLNAEIPDSSRRAAVLSIESMARRAAMGVFSPLVGLFGESDVMALCGLVGIAGFVVLAVARVRRGETVAMRAVKRL
jgi:MFS family permease